MMPLATKSKQMEEHDTLMSSKIQGHFQKEESKWYESRSPRKKDDVFPEIQFTIPEAVERDEGNRALRETSRGEYRTGKL